MPLGPPLPPPKISDVYDTVMANAMAGFSHPDLLSKNWMSSDFALAQPVHAPPLHPMPPWQTGLTHSLNSVAEVTKATALHQLDAALALLSLSAQMRQATPSPSSTVPAMGPPGFPIGAMAAPPVMAGFGQMYPPPVGLPCPTRPPASASAPCPTLLNRNVGQEVAKVVHEGDGGSGSLAKAKATPSNIGSRGHPELCRRPCVFVLASSGCSNGTDCGYCHGVHLAKAPHLDKRHREQLKEMTDQDKATLVLPLVRERLKKLNVIGTEASREMLSVLLRQIGAPLREQAGMPPLEQDLDMDEQCWEEELRPPLTRKQKTLQASLAKTHSLRALLSLLYGVAGPGAEGKVFPDKTSETTENCSISAAMAEAVEKLRDVIESRRSASRSKRTAPSGPSRAGS